MIRRIAGDDHDIEVRDMFHARVAIEAERHGIKGVPAVVIDGQLIPCSTDRGIDETVIRAALFSSSQQP